MKIISFELTMPNVGSWNGKWSGEKKKYYRISKFTDKYFNENLAEHFKDGKQAYWHYSWNDGWGVGITAEIIDSQTAKQRRKVSSGFCGYDWMIESIVYEGDILTPEERKNKYQNRV